MLPIRITQDSAEPLYHQIKVQLRALILSGKLEEGTPLPSIRELAGDLACSVITIRRVYQDLESEGLLRTRQGTGTFVAKVLKDDRERHRVEIVAAKFREAVATAVRYRCTPEEMRRLLEESIEEQKGTEIGGDRNE